MSKVQTGWLLFSMIALGACRNHEAVTGSYGNGVVTGRAMVVAGSSTSPAGVRVSVGGTGMSAILGDDGGFTFVGVPDNGELRFTREDGIDAVLDIPASSHTLSVRLQPTGIQSTSSRRRSAPTTPSLQFEGLIKSVTPKILVITASHGGDVTLQIGPDTRIRKGGTPLLVTDLKVGDRVHATASVKDEVKTAVEITLQNPEDDADNEDHDKNATMTANGTVTQAGATSLTVKTVPRGDVIVKVDGKTVIRKQGAIITAAGIHVGDEINSMGTRIDDHTMTAIQIEVRGNSKDDGGHGHH